MVKSAQLTWWAGRITAHLPSLSCRAGIEISSLAHSATAVLCVCAYKNPGKGAWVGFPKGIGYIIVGLLLPWPGNLP